MEESKNELRNEGTIFAVTQGNNNATINNFTTINNYNINAIQQQPACFADQQERGRFVLAGSSFAKGALISQYYQSRVKGCIPLSISIGAESCMNMEVPSAAELSSDGVLIYSHGTGTYTSCMARGDYTIQY